MNAKGLAKGLGKVALLFQLLILLSGCIFWKLTSDRTLSYLSLDWTIEDAVICGDYVYLTCTDHGLTIVDISDPISPYLVGDNGQPPMSFNGHRLAVSGNEVYLSAGHLQVVDVSDPHSPAEVNTIANWDPTGSYRWLCAVSGIHLLAAGRSSNNLVLRIYTISDIRTLPSPAPAGSLTVYGECYDWNFGMLVDGDYLYLLFPYSFSIVDISDKTNPTLLSTTSSPIGEYGNRCLAIKDDWLYMMYEADEDAGSGLGYEPGRLAVMDITDKSAPQVDWPEDEIGFPAIVSGGYLLSLYGFSIQVDELSESHHPEFVENLNVRLTGELICPSGDYAVVVDPESGELAVVLIAPYR